MESVPERGGLETVLSQSPDNLANPIWCGKWRANNHDISWLFLKIHSTRSVMTSGATCLT
jgi:hypothetical protein